MVQGKIRRRERIDSSPPSGMSQEWVEWQVVVGRKVYYRGGTEKEARRVAAEDGIQITN